MVEQLGHQNLPFAIGGEEQDQTPGLQHVLPMAVDSVVVIVARQQVTGFVC